MRGSALARSAERAAGPLDAFFAPRGIAVVGASDGNQRVGGRALFNLPHFGYGGRVYPVTRSHEELLGLRCYRSIADLPDPVDLAVICVSAARTPDTLRECGRRGIPAAVVFATGFGDATAEHRRLQAELEAAQRESGVRVIGPNTVGIRLVQTGVFATFAHDIEGGLLPGSVAVIAQSGGLGVYFGSAYLKRRAVGTRYLVDTGNELDIGSADVLDHIAGDPEVSCVGLILEGSRDGRRLARAVRRAVDSGKPVVFFKVGRSQAASRHLASHTGALSASAELFESAMRAAGAQIARDESELVDALVIHEAGKAPRGRRLGVVTPSGGYAILTIDAAEQFGMELPEPTVPPAAEDEPHLRSGTLANPYDWASRGPSGPRTREVAIKWMLGQPTIDAVLLWEAYSLEMEERRAEVASALAHALPGADKPLFCCGITSPEFEARLRAMGVLLFNEPMRLVKSLSVVAPAAARSAKAPLRGEPAVREASSAIAGARARAILTGIDHVPSVEVTAADEVARLCGEWGRVFLKVESDRNPHKTELGLVEGPLAGPEVVAGFNRLVAARRACGDESAPIVAQPSVQGVELALGAYVDPTFGPAVMVAVGGIFLEVLREARFAVAPITEEAAASLIRSLRGAALLEGARGRPPADVAAAARALAALSRLIAGADGAYRSVDVNPLMVLEEGRGAVAVDAVVFPSTGAEADVVGSAAPDHEPGRDR